MFTVQLVVAFSTFFEETYVKMKSYLHTIGSGRLISRLKSSRNFFSPGLAKTLKHYNNFAVHYPLLSMALTTGFRMYFGYLNIIFDC
jgi:hypothetical protein